MKPQAFALARCVNGSIATTAKAWPVCRTAVRGLSGCIGRRRSLVIDRIEGLRRQRLTGQAIAAEVGVSAATVSRVLKRLGLNQLSALEPAEPPRRYERERPGEMIHIDIKKLGKFDQIGHRITGDRTGQSNSRGVGWEFVHVCVDDASRIAFTQIKPDEPKRSAVAFLKAAVAYYASLGVAVERVMTDNGSCYKSFTFRNACRRLGLKHIRTRPYTPKPTARPSASSRPACANGPMPAPTSTQSSAPTNCPSSCTATTGIVLMPVSAARHLSANSV